MDELALGAILAVLESKDKLIGQSKYFIYLFIGTITPTIWLWTEFTNQGNPVIQITKFMLISLCYFSFIGYVITTEKNTIIKKFLTLKPLLYSGKISYGLYVFHPFAFLLFIKLFKDQPFYVSLTGGFIIAYAIAALSFHFFESKFLKLKKYFQ